VLDELSTSGTSIFVSTHAMDEVERCDLVGVMYRARLIACASPGQLKAAFAGSLFRVEAEPLLETLDAARRLPGVEDAALFGTAVHVTARESDAEALRQGLTEMRINVHSVERIAPELEDVFVQLITQSEREGAAAVAGSAV
jgi:ABC-2 type transport system ATP-binding protein